MKKAIFLFLLCMLLYSCSTLSKSQIESVHQFGEVTSNFSAYPSAIMNELAKIRVKRGLYYASTLTDPERHLNELDSIYSQKKYDYEVSEKIDITFRVIDKYAQSLILLSSEDYTASLQSHVGEIGVGMDSLVSLYNTKNNTRNLPPGIGEALGNIVSYGGGRYIRGKQAEKIKEYVTKADTLIAVMTTNLLEYLESSNLQELISYEQSMIRRNYLTYLQLTEVNTFESQRDYLDLKSSLDAAKDLRVQTIQATKDLKAAHDELVEVLHKKQKLERTISELQVFYQQVKNLQQTLNALNQD
ncbi:hypothetical protein RM553_15845 [Zunongwangia sp. F363]|uniref:Lipoprotein n=1 Tax=Autumnicola tepida TaxID=3075595 RepID=A0ABU3CDC5_9FLAO|nr:hypothetical protein [Zunongwangia sp. F363]MDT0644311.1 hypothetical protein [Zunongwangia sp. F363]